MKPYLYFGGLLRLINDIRGSERIHIGIRPYGFHAGNALALLAYPYLLCNYTQAAGKVPRYHFIISINDYEQDALAGPDPRRYPFNIHPTITSIQFTPDELGCCASITDHWEPRIAQELKFLTSHFPYTSVQLVRNSSLKQEPIFQDLLRTTLRHPQLLATIFKEHSGKEVLPSPLTYAGAICPTCKKADGVTTLENNIVKWQCRLCNNHSEGTTGHFDYWWYHKPMLVARLKIFDIDITLSGGDHYSEGDYQIRGECIQTFAPEIREPRMLFTPILFAPDGQKMSKSRNNTRYVPIGQLIELADNNCSSTLYVPKVNSVTNLHTYV